jgi:hypothetical protein
MNILLLADKDIIVTNLERVQKEISALYAQNSNITIKWTTKEFDYSDYPIEQYWGGYWGIAHAWLRARCEEVHAKHKESIDNVVFLIASDNWKLDRTELVGPNHVWGWNHSATMSGYGVQQVRFAQVSTHTNQRNVNNSIGTLYHEMHHDHDTFVFNYTGEVVERIVNVQSWDEDITHGRSPNWEYIRYKENQASLRAISTVLERALTIRRALYATRVSLMEKIIQLLERKVVLLRELLSRQRGDIAILPHNKCKCCTNSQKTV